MPVPGILSTLLFVGLQPVMTLWCKTHSQFKGQMQVSILQKCALTVKLLTFHVNEQTHET